MDIVIPFSPGEISRAGSFLCWYMATFFPLLACNACREQPPSRAASRPQHREQAPSQLARERSEEALPATCVVDLCPVKNLGNGVDIRVSVVFQTQQGIAPGQIDQRVSHPGKSRGSQRDSGLPKFKNPGCGCGYRIPGCPNKFKNPVATAPGHPSDKIVYARHII